MTGWTDAHERAFKVLADTLGWSFECESADQIEWVKNAVKEGFDELDKARAELAFYLPGWWRPRKGSLHAKKVKARKIVAVKDGAIIWTDGVTERQCSMKAFDRWRIKYECQSD
jgi:hypothetical protein